MEKYLNKITKLFRARDARKVFEKYCRTQSSSEQEMQEKFLLMDSSSLALWMEKMLLGYTAQSTVGNLPTRVSNSVRDLVIAFINALVSPSSDSKSRELCDHILDALHSYHLMFLLRKHTSIL